LIMHSQQPQRTRFVSAHLAAEAHDVREHDRREFASLSRCLWHEGNYSASPSPLSIAQETRAR
jgi:hypothetical protein